MSLDKQRAKLIGGRGWREDTSITCKHTHFLLRTAGFLETANRSRTSSFTRGVSALVVASVKLRTFDFG